MARGGLGVGGGALRPCAEIGDKVAALLSPCWKTPIRQKQRLPLQDYNLEEGSVIDEETEVEFLPSESEAHEKDTHCL